MILGNDTFDLRVLGLAFMIPLSVTNFKISCELLAKPADEPKASTLLLGK